MTAMQNATRAWRCPTAGCQVTEIPQVPAAAGSDPTGIDSDRHQHGAIVVSADHHQPGGDASPVMLGLAGYTLGTGQSRYLLPELWSPRGRGRRGAYDRAGKTLQAAADYWLFMVLAGPGRPDGDLASGPHHAAAGHPAGTVTSVSPRLGAPGTGQQHQPQYQYPQQHRLDPYPPQQGSGWGQQ
jgi:hypothetical protein